MPARPPADPGDIPPAAAEGIETGGIEGFVGYSVRRASLAIIENFIRRMAPLELRPVSFTLLTLVAGNPGITSSQLCTLLGIQSSNLVALVKQLLDRELIARQPHPKDGRAMGLHLTPTGRSLLKKASAVAHAADLEATGHLSDAERQTLVRLLKKIYQ